MTSTVLRRLAQRSAAPPVPQPERCDLCAAPLEADHRHLLDVDSGQPECACRACVILFDRSQAGGGHYRLIPERRVQLAEFRDDDRLWAALGIPVDLAFLTVDGDGTAAARYPSPIGLTTAVPPPDAWEQVAAANPVLEDMEPHVEALLLYRDAERWIVPIDDCFRLAARLRAHWSGFTGGDAVWDEIARFFAELRSKEVS